MVDSLLPSIFNVFSKLQEKFSSAASSSSPFKVPQLNQLNEMVYEVHTPREETELEIILFHGLQLRNVKDAHVTTWMSRDNSQLWVQTWLVDLFPNARVLSIAYNSSAEFGMLDKYCTVENLLMSLTDDDVRVGRAGSPVVFVGHCLGGLVMKEVCLFTAWMLARNSGEMYGMERIKELLSNIQGMFFYATPHLGSLLGNKLRTCFNGPFLEEMEILNSANARRNQDFDQLRSKYGWITSGMGESLETYVEFLGTCIHLVPEASSRGSMDFYYTAKTDHYDICKADGRKCSSLQRLKHLLQEVQINTISKKSDANPLVLANVATNIPPGRASELEEWTTTAHQTREQQVAKATLRRVAPLGFSQDSKYVPFEGTITKVRRALESKATGPVVMISGGPGQGKTSMAKYLACLYRDGTNPLPPAQDAQAEIQSTQTGSPNRFVDGVFFLHCGDEAESKSLLLQLWQDLGYQDLPLSTGHGQASSTEEMPLALQSEDAMRKQLLARLADQEILIILDDVWKSTIIDRVLVQQQGIKYLITTQISRIWTDAMCAEIPILKPTFQEANKILANHVKGFPTEVSSDLQVQINTIIKKSDANPLVLANVATNIPPGRASELEEWETTQRYLSDLQDGDAKRPPSLYGRSYSKKTMGASIEMALGFFSSEEQTLLFLACLCDLSQPVPEVVFKILFKKVHLSLAKFSRYSEQLETNNFIQVESKTNPSGDVPQRSWSLHTMRQKFMRKLRKEQIAVMFSKLLENSSSDKMVAILLVLYGQQTWRDQAANKMGIPAHQFGGNNSKAGYSMSSSIRPIVWLLNADGEEDWQKQSHHLAKQILHNYLDSCEVDNDVMSQLLGIPQTIPIACQALLQFAIFTEKPLFKNSNDNKILLTFVNLLKYSQNYLKEILSFFHELCFYYTDDAIKIGSYPGMVNVLTQFLAEDVDPHVQRHAAWTLGQLSQNVVDNAIKIGSCPNAVERLVGLLQEGVSLTTQHVAAWALGQLSQNVVDNAIKIGSCPNAMERLVGLLQEGVSPTIQYDVAWVLGHISKNVVDNAIKIGSCPNAVERLVGLLQEGVSPTTQQDAAWILGELSKNVVDNAIKIGSCPNAVERLVGLLQEGVSPTTQQNAAWVLGHLSKNVVDNAIKIGSCPNAVERLVGLLQEGGSPTTQHDAACTLGYLSKNVVDNAIKIGSCPNAVERLVGLLQEGGSPITQHDAACTLGHLSKNVVHNAIKIGSCPNAVERLVGLLQEGVSPTTQQNATCTLGHLSKNVVDNAIKIGSCPNAVERLVGLLQEGVSPTTQQNAAWVLGHLSKNVVDNVIKIGSYPSRVKRLVRLL